MVLTTRPQNQIGKTGTSNDLAHTKNKDKTSNKEAYGRRYYCDGIIAQAAEKQATNLPSRKKYEPKGSSNDPSDC